MRQPYVVPHELGPPPWGFVLLRIVETQAVWPGFLDINETLPPSPRLRVGLMFQSVFFAMKNLFKAMP